MAATSTGYRRNYPVFLAQGICVDIARNLASPKLVLPYLYLALGAPVFLAGALIPLVQLSRIAGQMLSAPLISAAPVHKRYLAAASLVIAAALACTGLTIDAASIHIIAIIFMAAMIGIGLGQAIGQVAFQQMLGSMMPKERRGALLFTQTAIGGVVAIAVALLLRYVFVDVDSFASHLALLWAGVAGYLLSAIIASTLQETRRSGQDLNRGPAAAQKTSYFEEIRAGTAEAFRVAWFRRFMVTLFLFASIDLAMPFYAIHAASLHSDKHGSLGGFVIAASIGLIVGGPFWQWLSRTSLTAVMIVGCTLAAIAGAFASVIQEMPFLHHEIYYGFVFFAVSAASQGIAIARKLYLVEAAPESRRAYYIAAAGSTIGVLAMPLSFALGVIAHLQHVVWPIYLLVGLNIAAIISVFFLDRPDNVMQSEADAAR